HRRTHSVPVWLERYRVPQRDPGLPRTIPGRPAAVPAADPLLPPSLLCRVRCPCAPLSSPASAIMAAAVDPGHPPFLGCPKISPAYFVNPDRPFGSQVSAEFCLPG